MAEVSPISWGFVAQSGFALIRSDATRMPTEVRLIPFYGMQTM